jgi:DNA polymerase I
MSDKIVFGKSNLKRVVGIEVKEDGTAELFQQDKDSSNIVSSVLPYRYWIVSPVLLNKNFARLKGNLHYKYGIQFTDQNEYKKFCGIWRSKDIYTIWNQEEAMMVKDGICMYQDMTPSELSLLSFDIETTGLNGYAEDAKVLLISTTYRDCTGRSINKLFCHDDYASEGEMIVAFCDYLIECNPSVLLGHNIITYDIPYLQARAETNNVALRMGRDESPVKFARSESKFRLDGTRDLLYKKVSVYGREICDTYFLSVSFDVSKSFESNALKPLIKQLGFEKEGRQYYDAGAIRDNYKKAEEWEKIKSYAEADAEDPIKLFDHMAPLYFNMCPMIPKPFTEILLSASGSKINALMTRAYLQDGHSIPKATEVKPFLGAISFAVPGIYNNCFKIDVASLYPNIIVQYEVYDREKDPNAYLLELVKTFKANRLKLKKLAAETGDELYKQMDTTTKGILNSFYGFLSAQGLNFNSPELAAFVTEQGRNIITTAVKWASGEPIDKYWSAKVQSEDDDDAA